MLLRAQRGMSHVSVAVFLVLCGSAGCLPVNPDGGDFEEGDDGASTSATDSDGDTASGFAEPHRFEILDAVAAPGLLEKVIHFVESIGGNDQRERKSRN